MNSTMETTEEIKSSCSLDLFEYISWKKDYPEEAKKALTELVLRFERDVIRMAEVACSKWGYDETVAFDISHCVFQRVWKYSSYKQQNSKSEDISAGIKLWLHRIVYTQLANYNNKGYCYEPDEETDLTTINSVEELIEKSPVPNERKRDLIKQLSVVDQALSQLSNKHKVIYLTYKLYCPLGNEYIPRLVSKKMQEELALVPASIRKYKEEANRVVNEYLSRING